jgi:hypothetical protein
MSFNDAYYYRSGRIIMALPARICIGNANPDPKAIDKNEYMSLIPN